MRGVISRVEQVDSDINVEVQTNDSDLYTGMLLKFPLRQSIREDEYEMDPRLLQVGDEVNALLYTIEVDNFHDPFIRHYVAFSPKKEGTSAITFNVDLYRK